MTSAFTERSNNKVSLNYGQFLINLSKSVPDGIVAFFPSYWYLEEIVTTWNK